MVTTVERTQIDIASMLEFTALRKALAEADHQGRLDPPSLLAQVRPGQPGRQQGEGSNHRSDEADTQNHSPNIVARALSRPHQPRLGS